MNFKKNEKTYDAEKSAVFKVLQEAENDPEPGMRVTIKVNTESFLDYYNATSVETGAVTYYTSIILKFLS